MIHVWNKVKKVKGVGGFVDGLSTDRDRLFVLTLLSLC